MPLFVADHGSRSQETAKLVQKRHLAAAAAAPTSVSLSRAIYYCRDGLPTSLLLLLLVPRSLAYLSPGLGPPPPRASLLRRPPSFPCCCAGSLRVSGTDRFNSR